MNIAYMGVYNVCIYDKHCGFVPRMSSVDSYIMAVGLRLQISTIHLFIMDVKCCPSGAASKNISNTSGSAGDASGIAMSSHLIANSSRVLVYRGRRSPPPKNYAAGNGPTRAHSITRSICSYN